MTPGFSKKKGFAKNIPSMFKEIKNVDSAKLYNEESTEKCKGRGFGKVPVFQKDVDTKKLYQKNTEFFASDAVLGHKETEEMQRNADSVNEIDLQCCGYGYFARPTMHLQSNFLEYLRRCLSTFHNLFTVKISFNGFDVSSGIFQELMMTLRNAENAKRVWVHTSRLANATEMDLTAMFDITAAFGQQPNCQEFSLQIKGWSFKHGLDFDTFHHCLQDFIAEIHDGVHFSNFRMELSSLNITEEDGEQFLKAVACTTTALEDVILRKWEDKEGNTHDLVLQELKEKDKERSRQLLREFLEENKDLDYREMQEEGAHREFKKLTGRGLVDAIRDARVLVFHKEMINIIHTLIAKMPNIEYLTIDMRDWHSGVYMGNLKKKLESRMCTSQKEFSIAQAKRLHRTKHNDVEGNRLVKIIYLM